jgi:hypothetical protein
MKKGVEYKKEEMKKGVEYKKEEWKSCGQSCRVVVTTCRECVLK